MYSGLLIHLPIPPKHLQLPYQMCLPRQYAPIAEQIKKTKPDIELTKWYDTIWYHIQYVIKNQNSPTGILWFEEFKEEDEIFSF